MQLSNWLSCTTWKIPHKEHGGTLGMVPLIINPINTLYSGYLLGISTFKGLLERLKNEKARVQVFL